MYQLYFLPGACSLATQVVLRELQQDVTLIHRDSVADYAQINPVGTVPSLIDGELRITEGVAALLHLLDKHPNTLLPQESQQRVQGIQDLLFANATMHPAYGRLFFIAANIIDQQAKQQAFDAAAQTINKLWQVVDQKLQQQTFLGGDNYGAADILLAVYSRWGDAFPVQIQWSDKVQQMLDRVIGLPNFELAIAAEQQADVNHG